MATEDDVKLEMLKDEDDAENDGGGSISADPRGDGQPAVKKRGRNLLFDDRVSRIDYILAWEVPKKENEDTAKARKARENFEKNLIEEGLKLEYDKSDEEVHYCKVHAPWEVLARYAEILKMKMRMKQSLMAERIDEKYSKWENPVQAVSTSLWNTVIKVKDILTKPFQLDEATLPKITKEGTLTYVRDREYLHWNYRYFITVKLPSASIDGIP